jgi:hypothetical protein
MDESQWYLRKAHDGSLFGPIPFEQLRQWAADAQVSPMDRVSTDQKTWLKAPMVPELAMDYLVEVGEDQFYGPTTIGAIREFLNAGEISAENSLTNSKDATQLKVKDLLSPMDMEAESNGAEASNGISARSSIRINLQQRVRELEEALLQERRARETAEHLVEKLEAQISELTAKT